MEKKLKSQIRLEALKRMELAARTEQEFRALEDMWDKLDRNRERRERYHEINGFTNEEWEEFGKNQDMLDIIFGNPEDMWQLIEDVDIANLVRSLSKKQKDVLYLSAIKFYSTMQIALVKEQSDRNIRKMKKLLLTNIRSKLIIALEKRIKNGIPITTTQRKFYNQMVEGKLDIKKSK